MYKHVLSIYLEQNDSWKQATFKNFGGNFLIFQQLKSNFWVYWQVTFPEFISTIYWCLVIEGKITKQSTWREVNIASS